MSEFSDKLDKLPVRDLSDVAKAVDEYRCPDCRTSCPWEDYVVDGERYPKRYNPRRWNTEDGVLGEWDEVYKCPVCGKVYKSVNSMYL